MPKGIPTLPPQIRKRESLMKLPSPVSFLSSSFRRRAIKVSQSLADCNQGTACPDNLCWFAIACEGVPKRGDGCSLPHITYQNVCAPLLIKSVMMYLSMYPVVSRWGKRNPFTRPPVWPYWCGMSSDDRFGQATSLASTKGKNRLPKIFSGSEIA
jgi:hypothetical protein